MQVYSPKLINDRESVKMGVQKIKDDYDAIIENAQEKYGNESYDPEYYILNDLVSKYNGGSEYEGNVTELMDSIEKSFFSETSDKLTDGLKGFVKPIEE